MLIDNNKNVYLAIYNFKFNVYLLLPVVNMVQNNDINYYFRKITVLFNILLFNYQKTCITVLYINNMDSVYTYTLYFYSINCSL